jgi:hypothetical protein
MTNLPTLDFAKFTHGTQIERQEIGQALTKSFIDHGFVKLINHGLPDATIADLLELVSQVRLTLALYSDQVLIGKVAEVLCATIVGQATNLVRS